MPKRLQLILALSVPLLTIALLIVLRDWVQATIVVPLLYAAWLGQLILSSIPQAFLWAVFLVLILRIAAGSLAAGRPKPSAGSERWHRAHSGRVQVLTGWIRATKREYFQRQLAHHLGELAVEATTPHELLSTGQINQALRNGELDAPPEILAYFQAGFEMYYSRRTSLFSRLARLFRKDKPTSPLDVELEKVVQFLESQLS